MKKIKIIVVLIIFYTNIFSQSQFSSFINRVNSVTDINLKTAIVDSFMTVARATGIPFIEGNTANFIYRGSANSVSVAGDMNGWNANAAPCTKLSGTNFFYFSANFELNARLDYKLVLNGSTWILDPENPKTCPGGFGPNSELAMPQFIQPWEIRVNNSAPQFSVQYKVFHSNIINRNYNITILLPPDYNLTNNYYPTVYFKDGSDYLNLCSAKNILTNLTDSNKIKNVIAVFITPTNRNDEYAYNSRFLYAKAFVEEIVPFIDANYRTIPNKYERLIVGDSFGGNISALIAYTYPDVIANCGLHSGAFWPNNFEVYNMIAGGVKKDLKFYAVWGTYESLFINMRSFIDSLSYKGYSFGYEELPQGHSWGLWRSTLDDILTYFFPYQPVSVKSEFTPTNFTLYQNYPNPFNPETKITFELAEPDDIELSVFDLLGNKLLTLSKGYFNKGLHYVTFNAKNFSSGTYFYTLSVKSKNKQITKKMVYIK